MVLCLSGMRGSGGLFVRWKTLVEASLPRGLLPRRQRVLGDGAGGRSALLFRGPVVLRFVLRIGATSFATAQ